jgi:hypothetical protein
MTIDMAFFSGYQSRHRTTLSGTAGGLLQWAVGAFVDTAGLLARATATQALTTLVGPTSTHCRFAGPHGARGVPRLFVWQELRAPF